MLQTILEDIQKERAKILADSNGAKIFLELAESKKLQRAAEVLKSGRLRITISEGPEGEVEGTCDPSSGGGEPYKIKFRFRSGRVRNPSCSCPDYERAPCKHVLALCAKWLLEQKRVWEKLGEAEKVLAPEKVSVAA